MNPTPFIFYEASIHSVKLVQCPSTQLLAVIVSKLKKCKVSISKIHLQSGNSIIYGEMIQVLLVMKERNQSSPTIGIILQVVK